MFPKGKEEQGTVDKVRRESRVKNTPVVVNVNRSTKGKPKEKTEPLKAIFLPSCKHSGETQKKENI